jgi:hypothetical protein
MTESSQLTAQGGNNFQPSWPENAGDLIRYLHNADNAGEQTRLFFKLAEEKPGVAFRVFVTILRNQASLPRRALALRGFGKITDPGIKQAIASCQSEDSQELLKWLSEELKGKGEITRDLTRWAAADAIQGIEFPPEYLHHSALGNLSEPPERIAQEIVERNIKQIDKIERLNGTGEWTVEYQRYIDFWIYRPTQELLKDNTAFHNYYNYNYTTLVQDVLWELQVLGVMLGLGLRGSYTPNQIVQEITIDQAEKIYVETENQKLLYEDLEYFINENTNDTRLRTKAVVIINTTGDWKPIKEKLALLISLLLGEVNNSMLWNTVLDLLNKQKQELDRVDREAGILLDGINFSLDRPNPQYLAIEYNERDISLLKDTLNKIYLVFIETSKALADRYKKSALLIIEFLENKQKQQLQYIDQWIKINHNRDILSNAVTKIGQENRNLYDDKTAIKLDSVENDLTKVRNDLTQADSLNYYRQEQLKSKLTELKKDISEKLNSTNKNFLAKFQKLIKIFGYLLACAIGIILVTYVVSSPLSHWFQNNSPTPDWFRDPNDTSVNTNNTTPWYLSGFPKNSCGSSSSSNNCWYPVFIEYSDRNWSRVISNHCQDIGDARNPKTAKSMGEIQVASFSNLEEAQGFANYMKTQYGSARVGQRKCL